jgi:DNA-binding SARP family transcriptional activator
MHALAPPKPAEARAATRWPRLLLLGSPTLERGPRREHPGWSYAKLPALLAVLAADGRKPVRREWLAALLWPDRNTASLRRALFELRRELGETPQQPPMLVASRQHLQIAPQLATDLDVVEAAWLSTRAAGSAELDVARASEAMALWRGELACDIVLHDAGDFDLWLLQARSRWEQRCLAVALALVDHYLDHNDAVAAAAIARLAVERAPAAEAARLAWWRCLVAEGQAALAAADWRALLQRGLDGGTPPSDSLAQAADALGLGAAQAPIPKAASPRPEGADAAALVQRLAEILRRGAGFVDAGPLVDELQRSMAGRELTARDVTGARICFTVRLHAAPWRQPMDELTEQLERLLMQQLPLPDRLSLTWPLATFHGWMGRGLRGEVLLRGVAHAMQAGQAKPGARVAFELAMALCHSCSTGDPEVSLRAARRGLRLARDEQLAGYRAPLHLVEANAALNLGDAAAGSLALRRVVRNDEALRPVDLAHYHQIGAYLKLLQGRHAEALAEASIGAELAARVGLPMQSMSCQVAALAARAALGEESTLEADFASCMALTQRIGADGYLMNLHLLDAALHARRADFSSGAKALAAALEIARRCGVRRLRKLPTDLLQESLAVPLRAQLSSVADAGLAARLQAALVTD